jgi:hypothetical protein
LGDLKACAVEVLQLSWEDVRPRFALDSSNICMFQKNSNELKPVPNNLETPASGVCVDNAHFAVEHFKTVPKPVQDAPGTSVWLGSQPARWINVGGKNCRTAAAGQDVNDDKHVQRAQSAAAVLWFFLAFGMPHPGTH